VNNTPQPESTQTSHVARLTAENTTLPKAMGRPVEWEKIGIYEAITRLKRSLGVGTTWKVAVDAYNREFGTCFKVGTVRQWGKRTRNRSRAYISQITQEEQEYGI
jgi:hypothetical protein